MQRLESQSDPVEPVNERRFAALGVANGGDALGEFAGSIQAFPLKLPKEYSLTKLVGVMRAREEKPRNSSVLGRAARQLGPTFD